MNVKKIILLAIILGVGGCSLFIESFSNNLSETEILELGNKNIDISSSGLNKNLDLETDVSTNTSKGTSTNIDADTSIDSSTNIDANTSIDSSTNMDANNSIDPSTNIDASTSIDSSTNIDANTSIDSSTNIDANTSIDSSTNIDANTSIDSSTNIDANTSIDSSTKVDSSEKTNQSLGSSDNSIIIFSGILIPLIVVLISNIVVLWKTVADHKNEIKRKFYFDRLMFLEKKLNEFYSPILTLLKTNSEMFHSMGPHTYLSLTGIEEHEAAELWNNIVASVIIPNNILIVKIIKEKSYLISVNDSLTVYLDYVKHAESFRIFRKYSHSSHKSFLYPARIIEHVSENNAFLRKQLNDLMKIIES